METFIFMSDYDYRKSLIRRELLCYNNQVHKLRKIIENHYSGNDIRGGKAISIFNLTFMNYSELP